MRVRPRLAAVLLAALAAAAPAGPARATEAELWSARDLTSRILFRDRALADLGIVLSEVVASAPVGATGELAFATDASSALRFRARRGTFDDFWDGTLVHRGGFALARGAAHVSLAGFRVRPSPAQRLVLDVLAATGDEVLFHATHGHLRFDPAAGRIALAVTDLRIAPALAARLGEPRLVGLVVGRLELAGAAVAPPGAAPAPLGLCPAPDLASPTDVALIGLEGMQQIVRLPNGLVAFVPSATLENVGEADVEWYPAFTPPPGDQHPFLVWGLYRLAGGVLEQLGASDVKHAYYAVNASCAPPCPVDGTILWSGGCQDTYGLSSNAPPEFLAPRDEITAHTVHWEKCFSHYDGDCDGVRDHFGEGEGLLAHAMTLDEEKLRTPGARYFFDAWYLVKNDVDVLNTMGWREVVPSLLEPNTWVLTNASPFAQGPIVDAWVDPEAPGPDAASTRIATGQGHLTLAARVTPLANGRVRYAYVLANHDEDRRIGSFAVPVGEAILSELGFTDADDVAATDWSPVAANGTLTWTAPSEGAALDWAGLASFRFEADLPPDGGPVALGLVEAPAGTTLAPETLVPGALVFRGRFEDPSAPQLGWPGLVLGSER